MISGLYSAATGMDAAALRHEAAAENLAHAHMPGFRRRIVHQTTFNMHLQNEPNSGKYSTFLGTSAHQDKDTQVELDFTPGSLKATDRKLDFALEGDGFFVVNGPQGPLYTRNGAFQASSDGRLVTVDGLAVSGANGDISIPANISSEAIEVTRDGQLTSDGQIFGQLELVRFEDLSELIPVGASLFSTPDGVAPVPAEVGVRQGFLESSNVAYMDELINIMVASRQFEAAQRAVNTVEESLKRRMQN